MKLQGASNSQSGQLFDSDDEDDATGDNVQVQAGVRGPKMPAFDEIKDDIDSIYIDSKDMQNYKNGKQVRGLYILVRC